MIKFRPSPKLQESVCVYEEIMRRYEENGVSDLVFRFLFRSFYRLDNAGLTDEWKEEFFSLLKKKETDLRTLLDKLHEIPTLRGHNSFQLSFATKLLHTLNPHLPIYDSIVAKKLDVTLNGKKTVERCIETYEKLQKQFSTLIKENAKEITALKKHYKTTITDEKAMDFLLWSE